MMKVGPYSLWNGVADVNITNLLNFHRSHGKEASITATIHQVDLGLGIQERI